MSRNGQLACMVEGTPAEEQSRVIYLGGTTGFFSREILRGILSMRQSVCDWDFWCMPATISTEELASSIEKWKVAGVISRGVAEETSRYLAGLDIPVVFIRSGEDESADYINGPHPDDERIGELAGEEFMHLNLGYWGFVHWDGVMWSDARRRVFHSYATARAVSNETLSLFVDERSNWSSVSKIADWLSALPKPCGVLACNDEAGLDVIRACDLLGLEVPGEVAVIGVDNDRLLCQSASVALSSIDLNASDTGRAAVIQLGKMMGELDRAMKAPSAVAKCVMRESCATVDRSKLVFQKAQDYIYFKPLSNIKVNDLSVACGVSRRGLERAFEKCGESSPAVLIREIRLKAIVSLLEDHSSSIESVAEQAGFSDAAGLSNFVKRMTGECPSAFR